MKTLISCSSAGQANIIKGHLENEGIPAYVVNQNSEFLSPTAFIDPYAIRILVDEKDIDAAIEILKKTYSIPVICPFCQSENTAPITKSSLKNNLKMLVYQLFGCEKDSHRYVCKDCTSEFVIKE